MSPSNAERVTRAARAAVIAVVVLDLVALAGLSVRVSSTTTRTVQPVGAATVTVPAPAVPEASAEPLPPGSPAPAPVFAAPVAANGVASTPSPVGTPATRAVSGAPAPRLPATQARTVDTTAQQACPIPLQQPTQSGGLQSLIDFAPAFGPLSAEAFAAAAAYQPALQLLGPILAQYPTIAPKVEPALAPLLNQWQHVLDSLYGLLGPYYTPYRTNILQGESTLATALAPYAQRLASSALGGCVVDLEAALVNDTK
jgi:hypothetical protein